MMKKGYTLEHVGNLSFGLPATNFILHGVILRLRSYGYALSSCLVPNNPERSGCHQSTQKQTPKILLTIGVFGFCLLWLSPRGMGQVDNSDHITWAGLQIRKNIDQNWSFQLQPIIRHNENISNYQNSSIDYSLRRKLNAGWHVQVIGRTWFMPDRADRQFFWLDIGRGDKIFNSKINLTNRVRWHHAFDIGGFTDPDFIRYMIQLVPNTDWKVKPRFGFEPWLQLNGFNSIRRVRFEPGLMFQFSKDLGLTLLWRRQNDINREVHRYDNLWVVALLIKA